jgi:DNA-binding CsgD family transcriptional regulator
MDDGVVAAIDQALPERLRALQRVSGIPVVFGGSTRPAPQGQLIEISRLVGTLGTSLRGVRVPAGRGLGGTVLRSGVPNRVNDYATADKISHDYDAIVVHDERLTSMFAVPVVVRGTVRAVFYGAVRGCQPIGDRAVRAAAVVAGQLARELERPPANGEDPHLASATALDELADVIRQTNNCDLRARLLRIHRQLGGRFAGEAPLPPVVGRPLSRRELDVLRLVAVGASNLEIAGELRLSPETVKTYLQTAMRRLGARNRTAAVHAARESGLLLSFRLQKANVSATRETRA